ncbi:MAG: rod shape-determining protein RodA [Alphaproteobacteria bacterium CG_4_10_14_0_8_um_filter_37_21]|nr:MAG: rod shape-determining protein RodA [Alphaproteobacteria bacterium CG_4_10_14_0_8_um_filter_37_21]
MIEKFNKIKLLPWPLIGVILIIAGLGILMLYSAANGNLHPWAFKQLLRLFVGLILMVIVALIDMRTWIASAYFFYAATLALLVFVELLGFVGMGAQRWIDLYIFNLQPSELMRLALLLALGRYFYTADSKEMRNWRFLVPPVIMIVLPVALVCRQPDLGTALLLMMGATSILFVSGIHWGYFLGVSCTALASAPVLWSFLHTYQKNRILNFLTPERDPMRTGYHVVQSKIALGSGEVTGKGFLKGTQSHLNFLPEKQTDFIFTMYGEEFGFLGCIFLIALYCIWLLGSLEIALNCKHRFGQLLGVGITLSFFVYVFVNIAMVMGLLPVVGIPLPFFSYGGTALITLLISQGVLFSVHIHTKSRGHRLF